jgi:hypothetical protein
VVIASPGQMLAASARGVHSERFDLRFSCGLRQRILIFFLYVVAVFARFVQADPPDMTTLTSSNAETFP